MYFDETFMVDRVFDGLLESRNKGRKSSHGPKLSEKCHEKVNVLQEKTVFISKNLFN